MLETLGTKIRQTVQNRTSLYIGKRFFSHADAPLFDSVELELRSVCNSTCSFCAAAVQFKSRPDQSMTDGTFNKILGDLSAMDYSGRICFYINTEPFVDKRLPEFISRARS